MKFRNILNYEPSEGVFLDPISETLPDQTMSIRTILSKYTRGEPIHGSMQTPLYFGEDDYVPDPRSLDLVDFQEMKEQNAEAFKRAQRAKKAPAKQAEGAVETPTEDFVEELKSDTE